MLFSHLSKGNIREMRDVVMSIFGRYECFLID